MSVSTTNHNISPTKSNNRVVIETLCHNGRTVRVVELRSPHADVLYAYDVTVIKTKGEMEVVKTTQLVGEALQAHFRLVTKFGGIAKTKTPEEIEAEKHRVLDEIIDALDSPSVEFGRDLGRIEKSKTVKNQDDHNGLKPRKSKFNIMDLDYQNSAVDACKALGWDHSQQGRTSIALQLGYRGEIIARPVEPLNQWLVKEINQRYGSELQKRKELASGKKEIVVHTFDWDEMTSDEVDYQAKMPSLARKIKNLSNDMEYIGPINDQPLQSRATKDSGEDKPYDPIQVALDYFKDMGFSGKFTKADARILLNDFAGDATQLSVEDIHDIMDSYYDDDFEGDF